jgi:hypothetical protein
MVTPNWQNITNDKLHLKTDTKGKPEQEKTSNDKFKVEKTGCILTSREWQSNL